jgi:hypothetical protein
LRYKRGGVTTPIKNDRELAKMGYRRLAKPRLLTTWSREKTRSPFEAASEGEVYWCARCKDHLPDESSCSHVYWCDDCGGWFYCDTKTGNDDDRSTCDCPDEE